MNGLGKTFRKKPYPKNWKKRENQSEIAACEQKTTSEKANFCSNTVFSLHFKFRAKKFHAAKPLAFSLYFLFRQDQNHYSNLTSKIMKMFEQILKKHSRKNSGNDSKDKIAQTYDLINRTTILNPEPPQMPQKIRKNRNGIRTQIEQKKQEELNEFFNSTRKHKNE